MDQGDAADRDRPATVGDDAGEPVGFSEDGIDFDRANAARIYDYLLGGAHNFAVDRDTAHRILDGHPDIRRTARANRAFLGRLVRWCLDRGVRQFLDLGSGVPTVGNVHDIAHALDPTCTVAYVDFEPVAVAYAEEILGGDPRMSVTRADIRDPAAVLAAPGVTGLLDLRAPTAVLACAVLHFVDDDLPAILDAYGRAVGPGSVLGLSHSTDEIDDPELAARMRHMRASLEGSATEGVLRGRHAITEALGSRFRLLDPGLVDVTRWPEDQAEAPVGILGGVAERV